MTIIQLTGRIKYRGLSSERDGFNPGGDKRIGARYYCIDTKITYDWDGTTWIAPPGGGMASHGNEYHTSTFMIGNQAITAATNTKITYDAKGLVTSGAAATPGDIGAEPANSNIQTHVTSAHAPSNAQKNSDITKAEIEAKLTGEISTHTHAGGGGSNELWEGKVHVAMFDGNPLAEPFQSLSSNTTISPAVTPTNIGIAVGRMVAFRFKTAITVATIRWHGIGAVSTIYTAAIYRDSDGARLWAPTNVDTAANAWSSSTAGLPITLAADTLYWFGIGADTIGTTAGFVTPQLPKVASFGLANPAWAGLTTVGLRFCQVALTNGVFPATLPSKVNAAAWTGFIPVFYLCASGY